MKMNTMMMKMAHPPRSCGELREAGTIGQIQLAMLTPVGSYSAKDKTGEEMIQKKWSQMLWPGFWAEWIQHVFNEHMQLIDLCAA